MIPTIQRRDGRIVTFYSFKGGTGRTMALANVAYALAESGRNVLMVDFDLEAPGLSNYFESAFHTDLGQAPGLIEFLGAVQSPSEAKETWMRFRQSTGIENLDIVTSGSRTDAYPSLVEAMDWDEFFRDRQGGEILEALRSTWCQEYDFVFIDSRTGLTDSGGICTIHLPDVIVSLCTPNNQSLDGTVDVVERAQHQRFELAHERGPALVLPLISRIDDRTEKKLAVEWMDRAEAKLGGFVEPWLPESIPVRQLMERTKLPYITYYSYGEEMPVREDSRNDPGSLGYALRTVAAVIRNGFDNLADVIGENPVADFGSNVFEMIRGSFSSDSELEFEVMAVLARLSQSDLPSSSEGDFGHGGVAIPADLLGNGRAVEALTQIGVLARSNGMVTAHLAMSTLNIPGMKSYVDQNADVLSWSRRIREKLSVTPMYRLDDQDLGDALSFYEERPLALTSFERSLVEDSLKPTHSNDRDRQAGLAAIGLGALAGLSIALIVGAVIPSSPAATPLIGAAAGVALGIYFSVLWLMHARRMRRRETVELGIKSSWTNMRAIGEVLSDLGYDAEVHGSVALFRMENRSRRRTFSIQFVRWSSDPATLKVVVTSPELSGQCIAEGPSFAIRRLERAFAEAHII